MSEEVIMDISRAILMMMTVVMTMMVKIMIMMTEIAKNNLVIKRMRKISTIALLMIKIMKKLLMTVAVTKMIIMIMIMVKIMKEMGTLLFIQNDEDNCEDIYDDGDFADKRDVDDYAADRMFFYDSDTVD
jgi:hypothetical protein